MFDKTWLELLCHKAKCLFDNDVLVNGRSANNEYIVVMPKMPTTTEVIVNVALTRNEDVALCYEYTITIPEQKFLL